MNIYADNAATTKMSAAAIRVMTECMNEYYGNPSSLYRIGQRAKEKLEDARLEIAKLINAEPKEIIFTSGGSESDNQALLSACMTGKRKGKMHIVSSAFEHHAILHTLIIRVQELETALRDDTCLVTIMTANNEIGTIQPISEIGEICRKRGITFHTDAVQAVGHLPIDVKAQNIDMLSASAHKFHGPKGTGFLYCRKGIVLSNLIEGGAQERGKRAGTENLPGIMAMAEALKESAESMEKDNSHKKTVRDHLIKGLSEIPHSALNGDAEKRLSGNVNFSFEGIEGESLLILLDKKGISASSGSACTSGALDPSHVLLSIGRIHDVAHGSLRLTIGEDITLEEADYIIEIFTCLARPYRRKKRIYFIMIYREVLSWHYTVTR